MVAAVLPLTPEPWATAPATDSVLLLEQLATLRLENAALQERIRELEARLVQTSANSSRPPSADPFQAPARPKAPCKPLRSSERRDRGEGSIMSTSATIKEVMRELATLEDPKMREVNERRGDDHGVNLMQLRA